MYSIITLTDTGLSIIQSSFVLHGHGLWNMLIHSVIIHSDLHPSFVPGQQQDAHEFMIQLLDLLLSHIPRRFDGAK